MDDGNGNDNGDREANPAPLESGVPGSENKQDLREGDDDSNGSESDDNQPGLEPQSEDESESDEENGRKKDPNDLTDESDDSDSNDNESGSTKNLFNKRITTVTEEKRRGNDNNRNDPVVPDKNISIGNIKTLRQTKQAMDFNAIKITKSRTGSKQVLKLLFATMLDTVSGTKLDRIELNGSRIARVAAKFVTSYAQFSENQLVKILTPAADKIIDHNAREESPSY